MYSTLSEARIVKRVALPDIAGLDRIGTSRFLNVLDNSSGNGPDISAAVPADLGFIVQATQ